MKKIFLEIVLCVMLIAVTAVSVSAYILEDDDEWYSPWVDSSSKTEQGSGETPADVLSPVGKMTVGETVTVAAKLNAAYYGRSIEVNSGNTNPYDSYVSYAKNAGIIQDGWFDDYDREISRWETARVIANAVPESCFEKVNKVDEIPDVPETNAYFEDALLLYNAGIMMGRDEYGTFAPLDSLTRSEAAAVFSRIAFPDTRLVKTLTDANYGDAYYLLYQRGGLSGEGASYYDTAWNYDNRNRVALINNTANSIYDNYTDGQVVLWYDLEDVEEGLLGWTMKCTLGTVQGGVFFSFCDDSLETVFDLTVENGKFCFNGTNTYVDVVDGLYYISVRADLDNRTAMLYIDGREIGKFEINDGVISRFYVGSPEESIASVTFERCEVFKDYVVNEKFIVPENSDLAGWETDAAATVVTTNGQAFGDARSAKLTAGAQAYKSFNKISGDTVLEAYMLFPTENDTGYITLNSGNKTVARINVNADGVFRADGTKLRHHTNNIWQCLRIEADTVTGKAVYKVNGKVVGEFNFDTYAPFVDGVTVGADSGTVYFDDVMVFLTHEYDDYCPEPVPVTDDGYNVILNMCSLWLDGAHFGWSAISPYPDVEPALGYYDEGLPEVADWEIKFMVENGIDVQHLCWYSPADDIKEPIKRSQYNEALHDGFFNSKYSNMMKFTFMWENTGVGCKTLEQFKEYYWKYWMDYYFLDDRFFTIDNKIVITAWSYGKFKEAFGGTVEKCLEAVEFMNEDAKAHGFDGVLIFFNDGHQQTAAPFAAMAEIGGSGSYAYHWQQDGISADRTIARLQKNQNFGEIHIVPTVSVGFNNIGWSGERKPLASLEDHKKVLEYIKNDYLTEETGWKSKTLVVSTWNEYGEGTYVMPVKELHGFGYLENVAEVISGDTRHKNNIYPTQQQKARLGHIYPDSKTSLATLDYGYYGDVIFSIDGDDVKAENHITGSSVNGVFKGTSTGDDPFLFIKKGVFNGIEADKVKALRLLVKTDVDSIGEIHFRTASSTSWTATKCIGYRNEISDSFVEILLPTEGVQNWEGTITDLRFDVVHNVIANFEFAKCEFIGYENPVNLTIDGVTYTPSWDGCVWEENGEIYCPAEPISGFFSLNNYYYEWSRYTNKLYILTQNGNEFEFKAGSKTAKFNGNSFTLAKSIQLVDGVPVVPLKTIYDKDGTNYSVNGNTVTVRTVPESVLTAKHNRIPTAFEFNVDGDFEKVSAYGTTIFVYDGALHGKSTPLYDGAKSYYDPMFTISGISVDTSVYKKIVIAMKHDLDGRSSDEFTVYFRRSDAGLSEARTVKANLSGNSGGKYIEYVFDLSQNSEWKGTVTGIRVDPMHKAGTFSFDYIRFEK